MRRPGEERTANPYQLAFEGWLPAEDDLRDTDQWFTPPELVHEIAEFYGGAIDLDPCWSPDSYVHPKVGYTIEHNGLEKSWRTALVDGVLVGLENRYVNPPYSNPGPWLDKIVGTHMLSDYGREFRGSDHRGPDHTIALLKVDMSTLWWQRGVWEAADAICWLYKRLPYVRRDRTGSQRTTAQWPSALVYWGDAGEAFGEWFAWLGHISHHDKPDVST